MSKLYFKYGTMNSSKTANLLMVAHNYEIQGKRVICYKPYVDTRWGAGEIRSRSGIPSRVSSLILEDTNMYDDVVRLMKKSDKISCILVDEAQFLRHETVRELARVVDEFDIPVICFGLKNTYKDGELFEGSTALMYYADSIEEIKTVCQYCNKKATMNLRVVNGAPVYDGDSDIELGDVDPESEEYYVQTCRGHYYSPEIMK